VAFYNREIVGMPLTYSILEYKELVNSAPPYALINHINHIIVKGFAFNDISCTSIEEFIKKNYPSFYNLFYERPLDMIPLLINHEIKIVKVIVLWRLRIGK